MTTEPSIREVLGIALEAAVSLRMLELAVMTPEQRDRTRRSWADDAATVVGSQGDALQFGGKPGRAANAFNHMARGLAALAYTPGGVTFLDRHWCANHQQCLSVEIAIADGAL